LEQLITWGQVDYPPYIPSPGRWALVVDPILYLEMLHRMKFLETQLAHSHVTFHGMIPGRKCKSLGSIKLNVTFDNKHNFRTKKLHFEVVPFKTAYQAIFGRSAFALFMACSCYIYNKLMVPGPNGVITIKGDAKKAHECELGNATFAETVFNAEELKRVLDPKEMPTLKKPSLKDDIAFTPSKETKKIHFVYGDTTKTATIGAGLDDK
jgi:hypothetical protein